MKNKLTIIEQSTIETCLPACIISFLEQKGIKVFKDEEMNILIEGLKFTKYDYSTGQLVYVSSKYKVETEQFVDYIGFYKFLSKYKYPPEFKLIHRKIDKKAIKELIKSSPIIIYIDHYFLVKNGVHTPHFIIVEKINDFDSVILDPWFGKRKIIPTKTLIQSIQSLRNKLKISPKIIIIK